MQNNTSDRTSGTDPTHRTQNSYRYRLHLYTRLCLHKGVCCQRHRLYRPIPREGYRQTHHTNRHTLPRHHTYHHTNRATTSAAICSSFLQMDYCHLLHRHSAFRRMASTKIVDENVRLSAFYLCIPTIFCIFVGGITNHTCYMYMQRDIRLDWIRTLAILLVITVHTWSLSGIDGNLHPMMNVLYNATDCLGVPLFLMLSGALLLGGENSSSLSHFYRKRYKRLLIPFLIWATIVFLISLFVGKYTDIHTTLEAASKYIPYMLENKINSAYWFVALMTVLYAITPFIRGIVKRLGSKGSIAFVGIYVALLALRQYYPEIYIMRYTSALLYYLGLYIAGAIMYTYAHQLRYAIYPLTISFILFVIEGGTSEALKALCAIALFATLLSLPFPDRRIVRTVSDTSYATYLYHMMLITPLYRIIAWNPINAPTWMCAIMPIATTIVVATICSMIGYVMQRFLPHADLFGIASATK